MHSFVLTNNVAKFRGADARVLEIPQGLANKNALLAWYASALEFPSYFGANWDAFEECLRDLVWLKEHTLVLFHRDMPLAEHLKDQRTYIAVLAEIVRHWNADEDHAVIAAFDPACALRLRQAMKP